MYSVTGTETVQCQVISCCGHTPPSPFLQYLNTACVLSLSSVAWVLVYSRPVSRGDRRRSDSIQSITSVYTDISKCSIACSRSALLQGFSSEENVSSHVIYRLATCTCHTNCISITYITNYTVPPHTGW